MSYKATKRGFRQAKKVLMMPSLPPLPYKIYLPLRLHGLTDLRLVQIGVTPLISINVNDGGILLLLYPCSCISASHINQPPQVPALTALHIPHTAESSLAVY